MNYEMQIAAWKEHIGDLNLSSIRSSSLIALFGGCLLQLIVEAAAREKIPLTTMSLRFEVS